MPSTTHLSKPVAGRRLRLNHPLSAGLQFYLLFDTGNGVRDLVTGNRWSLQGTTTTRIPGFDGGFQYFWPTSPNGFLRSPTSFQDTTFNRGASLFARVSPAGASDRLMIEFANASNRVFQFYVASDHTLRMNFTGNGTGSRNYTSSEALAQGVPVNLGARLEPNIATPPRLFINEKQSTFTNASGSGTGPAFSGGSAPIRIGCDSSETGAFFLGGMEVIAAWSRPLSDQEHQQFSLDPYQVLEIPRRRLFTFLGLGKEFRGSLTAEITAEDTGLASGLAASSDLTAIATIDQADTAMSMQIDSTATAIAEIISSIFKSGNSSVIYEVSDNADDGTISSASINTGSLLTLSNTSLVYFRFQGIEFPADAYVREARLQLQATGASTPVNISIFALKQDYSWVPDDYPQFLNIAKTSLYSTSLPTLGTGSVWYSPNLASVVQELSDFGQRQPTTAVLFCIDTASVSTNARFWAAESGTSGSAKLLLEFGIYTSMFTTTCSAVVTISADLRYDPIVGAALTSEVLMTCRNAVKSEIEGTSITAASTFYSIAANTVLAASEMTAATTVVANLQYAFVGSITSQVIVAGEISQHRPVDNTVGTDYTSSLMFNLIVDGDVLDVSQ